MAAARRAAGALLVSIAIASCGSAALSASPFEPGAVVSASAALDAVATAGLSPSALPATCPERISNDDPATMDDARFAWSEGQVAFCQTDLPDPNSDPSATFDENAPFIAITPWVSSDGRSWQRGQPLEVGGIFDSASIRNMVEGSGGLLAVAQGDFIDWDRSGNEVDWQFAVVGVWTSKDGKAWKRLDFARTFGVTTLGDLEGGRQGYIASNLSDQPATNAPAIWLSADGLNWKAVAIPKGELTDAHVGSAYVLPNGYLLAGWKGAPVGADFETTPAMWFSPDGVTWRETPLPGVLAAPAKEAVLVTNSPGRYVVRVGTWSCGCEPPRDDQAWISTDGIGWQPYSGGD
jgi:hypothetical protein